MDLDAFKNLTDPREIEFLRKNLSRKNFSKMEKERKRVALLYLKDIARNCVLLIRIGEAAAENPNPDISMPANKLSDAALDCAFWRCARLSAFTSPLCCLFARAKW